MTLQNLMNVYIEDYGLVEIKFDTTLYKKRNKVLDPQGPSVAGEAITTLYVTITNDGVTRELSVHGAKSKEHLLRDLYEEIGKFLNWPKDGI